MNDMQLTLRTPEQVVYEGPASVITGVSELGAFQLYPGHTAMTTTLSFAPIEIRHGSSVDTYYVRQGVLNPDPFTNQTHLLAVSCEQAGDADISSLKEYRDFVLAQLDNQANLNDYQVTFLQESASSINAMISHIEQ